MASIVAEDLSFAYTGPGGSVQALSGLDLRVEDGEFMCIVGRSGCGKSTLMRLLAGLERPDSGRILVDGREITGPDPGRMIVFQSGGLFPWLRVRDNVAFAAQHSRRGLSRRQCYEISDQLLEQMGLTDAARLFPCQLSGGMTQRAAIARALATDAQTLLLDEPFSALDIRTREQLRALLLNLWQNSGRRCTVIFVTHDVEEALLLADRIACMRPGRVQAVIDVDIERPRTGDGMAYNAVRQELLRAMYEGDDSHAPV